MTLVGKYRLVSKLATGGMAEVFLAKVEGPMGFEKSLVLKRILPHLAEDPQFVGMFFTEARVAAQLNHPNIVQIFDFGQASGTYYIAMEFIDGPDLRTLARRALDAGVALSPAFCARLISMACEGLAFAHDFVDPTSGKPLDLIHRDISPDNLLLSRQGTVKVVDFGIAKASNQSHKTGAGLIKGKLAYMPPEQLQGHGVDRRVDVYALGVVLYELLTGRYPFEASTDVSMMQAILFEPLVSAAVRRPDLPPALVSILDRTLSKVREQRYPNCIELQADLERFLASCGESVGARDLAQAVERLCPRSAEPQRVTPSPAADGDIGFADTALRPSGRYGTATQPVDAEAMAIEPAAPHSLAPVRGGPSQGRVSVTPSFVAQPTERLIRTRSPRRRLGLALALGGMAIAVGNGVVHLRRSSPPPPAPSLVDERPPPRMALPSSKEERPEPVPPPAPPAVSVPEKVVAAPPTVVEPPPAPPPEAPKPAEPPAAPHKVVARPKLVIRVRPYATVFLDGTALGQTPLPAQVVSPGEHTVRLINRDLNKDLVRTVEVKPGAPTVFTLSLEDN